MRTPTTNQSLNYNTVANQLDINAVAQQALQNSGFLSIKQNGIQITASDSNFAQGQTTSVKAGAVSYFNTPANTQGSISIKGTGQQVSVSSSPTGALAPIATANSVGSQASSSTTMWYILGGVAALLAILFLFSRKP